MVPMTDVEVWGVLDRLASIIATTETSIPFDGLIDYFRGTYMGVPLSWDDYVSHFNKIFLGFDYEELNNGKTLKAKLKLKSKLECAMTEFAKEIGKDLDIRNIQYIMLEVNGVVFVENKAHLDRKVQLWMQSQMQIILGLIDSEIKEVVQIYNDRFHKP